jgi:hypothetical protein
LLFVGDIGSAQENIAAVPLYAFQFVNLAADRIVFALVRNPILPVGACGKW